MQDTIFVSINFYPLCVYTHIDRGTVVKLLRSEIGEEDTDEAEEKADESTCACGGERIVYKYW